jgi:hypothetical protein
MSTDMSMMKMRYIGLMKMRYIGLEAMFQAKRARFQGMGWDETGYVFPRRKKGRHN